MKKIFLSLVISIFLISLSYGEYVMKWTNRYDSGNPSGDTANGIAIDSFGNIYVTGQYHNGVNWDYCTIKYGSSSTALWTNIYDSGGLDCAHGVAVDSPGNVYVTGYSSIANNDYCTIKYDSSGSVLWTNFYDGSSDDMTWGVAIDSPGNVYVAGYSFNRINCDYCIIKYDSTGSALWTNFYDGGSLDDARGVAVDSSGNVYVTGESVRVNYDDYCTIKYNSSGSALWTNFYDGGDYDSARGIAVDLSGNVYVTGYSSRANNDFCTIKYNSTGFALWTNFYDGGSSDQANGIAVDSFGNVYVTGGSSIGANVDYCTIKYDSSGSALWTNFYDGGIGTDWAHGIVVATNFNPDRIFVTGAIFNGANNDYFTYGIPPQGKPINFSGTPISTNSIVWQWTDKSDDEIGFQIQNPAHNIKGSVGVNITIWTEKGLSPNTAYTRHCVATNELGKSFDSNQDIVITRSNTAHTIQPPKYDEPKVEVDDDFKKPGEEKEFDIGVNLNKAGKVTIEVYDIQGELVHTICRDEQFDKGYHNIRWEVKNALGSGVYWVVMKGEDWTKTKRVAIVK